MFQDEELDEDALLGISDEEDGNAYEIGESLCKEEDEEYEEQHQETTYEDGGQGEEEYQEEQYEDEGAGGDHLEGGYEEEQLGAEEEDETPMIDLAVPEYVIDILSMYFGCFLK